MRQICLDLETTGLSPSDGHRIVEIGCVEIVDRKVTGNEFHCYINPERKCDAGAFKVHGLSDEFLEKQEKIEHFIDYFHYFMRDADEIIIHNARFDLSFLRHEQVTNENYGWVDFVEPGAIPIICTMKLAKEKGHQKTSLNALCEYYGIDISHRTSHGALTDAELLAKLYLRMTE